MSLRWIHAAALVVLTLLVLASARPSAAQQTGPTPASAASSSKPAPLSGRERWNRYLDETYLTPWPYVVSLGAGLAYQAGDYPPQWRSGFAGYARRTGNQYGIIVLQNSIHEAGEAAVHYDPRYFACRCSGFWHRTGHAFEMSFVTYDQNGHKRFDFSQLAGAYGAGILSALWYPRGYSPWVQGIQTGHTQFGFVVGTNLVEEFSPELKRLWPVRKFMKGP